MFEEISDDTPAEDVMPLGTYVFYKFVPIWLAVLDDIRNDLNGLGLGLKPGHWEKVVNSGIERLEQYLREDKPE